MSTNVCQHCNSPIPEAFASMPVCSICGGDLNAPAENSTWSAIAINSEKTRVCDSCGSEISSVLAMECPECGKELSIVNSKHIEEIQEVKEDIIEKIVDEEIKKEIIEEELKQEIQEEIQKIEEDKKEFVPPTVVIKTVETEKLETVIEKTPKIEEDKKENFFVKLLRKLGFKI